MKKKYIHVLIAGTIAVLLTSAAARASETDDRIESSAKQSYVFKTYLEKDAIKIKVKEGVVTLTGTVDQESHKSLATETVASLPGVKSVHNQLKLSGKHPAENSDAWIAMQVKYSLLYNRNVSGMSTQVDVANGIVTLRGEAENQAQKELTGEYAKDIKGVKEIKNEMTIAKTPSKTKEKVMDMIDDASITALVKMALLLHHSTSAFMTGVTTNSGVVTLTGKTSSGAAKDMAGKVTGNVHGVTNVVNNMTIKEPAAKN